MIALIGQFSAASRIFSSLSPAGSTASDWRSSLSRNTLGAYVSHIALPTQRRWSTRTRSLRAIAASLLPMDRQRLERPEGDARLIFQRFVIDLEAREALGERFEHLLTFDPRQRGAEAMMNTRAKSDVLVRPALDVEGVRLLEHAGIAISGGNEPADAIVFFQDFAAHLDILRRNPLDR